MAQPRSQHYWRQLRGALTAGQWDATAPAKDWHQRPCSWSELIRKFLKHSPDHRDVAELASQTQALCLLLSANATNLDGSDVGPRGPLVLGEECALPEERIEEASAGYESLKQLDASRSDVREAVSQIQTLFDLSSEVHESRVGVLRLRSPSTVGVPRAPGASQGLGRRARLSRFHPTLCNRNDSLCCDAERPRGGL